MSLNNKVIKMAEKRGKQVAVIEKASCAPVIAFPIPKSVNLIASDIQSDLKIEIH